MLATITSGALLGVQGIKINIEVQRRRGLPSFATVGLPEAAVREAQVRVRSAIHECGYAWPPATFTVNLAPADIRKEGSAYDLPIALGILACLDALPRALDGALLPSTMVIGELGLSGEVRPVRGALPLTLEARKQGMKRILVPMSNASEAALVRGIDVVPVSHLRELVAQIQSDTLAPMSNPKVLPETPTSLVDMADVKGQHQARRALEIAAAGGHNLLFVGPPGSGKTMLARRLPTLLPTLRFEEALEVTSIYSVAGLLRGDALVGQRPFRAPHHTISDVGLVGGGARIPRPGEVSLSHHGVLFLDELPEFKRAALEVLRQPLEDRQVTLNRQLTSITYPSSFTLVASMNPCPCGYLGSTQRRCICSPERIHRYRARISGPLLDRIDLQVDVPDLSYQALRLDRASEPSSTIRDRVLAARERQATRLKDTSRFTNAQLMPQELERHCALDEAGHRLLEKVTQRLGLSARAHGRILRVARTLADLEGVAKLTNKHLSEAVAYRSLDRPLHDPQRGSTLEPKKKPAHLYPPTNKARREANLVTS